MKKLFYLIFIAVVVVSCHKDEVNPGSSTILPNPVSLQMTVANSELKIGNVITITSECTLNSDSSILTYIEKNVYLSKDKAYSDDDVLLIFNSYFNYSGIGTNNLLGNGTNKFYETFSIPASTDTGSYYIITRYRLKTINNILSSSYYSDYYLAATTSSLSLTHAIPKVFVTSMSVNPSRVSAGGSITVIVKYTSTLNHSVKGSLLFGISPDSTLTLSYLLTLLTSSADATFVPDSGKITQTLILPSASATVGNSYYIYYTATYIDEDVSYTINSKSIKIPVKPFIESFSFTGFVTDKTTYSYNDPINVSGGIINSGNTTDYARINYYLSKDTVVSSNDTELGSSLDALTLNSGATNSFSDSPAQQNSNFGSYYLIAIASIAMESYSSSSDYIYARSKISITEPLTTITQLSVNTSNLNVSPGTYLNYDVTTEADISDNFDQKYILYLSTDEVLTLDDYYIEKDYIQFSSGTRVSINSAFIPLTLPSDTYYLILRSDTSNGSSPKNIVSSNTIKVAYPSIIFYRNSPSTITDHYLFIDDTFVYNLSIYESFINTDCTSYTTNYNYGSSYQFRGSYGAHTYKVCTTTDLSTGTILKSGSFTTSPGSCNAIDIDTE